jgi:hypothetical protein
MFMLTLPKGETSGKCRINRQDAEYELFAGYISVAIHGGWPEPMGVPQHPRR